MSKHPKISDEIFSKMLKGTRETITLKKEELASLQRALEGMQDMCDHDWHYLGHGHNDYLYECSICGKEEFR